MYYAASLFETAMFLDEKNTENEKWRSNMTEIKTVKVFLLSRASYDWIAWVKFNQNYLKSITSRPCLHM